MTTKSTLMAGLIAALAGTAAFAQDAPATAAPDAAATAAPDAPLAPRSMGGGMEGPMGPEGGPDGGVPNMGPLSIAAYDADGDGLVTRAEVEARKAARFAEADADGDGGLSADELVSLREIVRRETEGGRMQAMIDRFDDNGDGLLQATEIEDRTPRLQPLFDRLDADGDGAISQAELDAARPMPGERMGRGRGPGPDGGPARGHGGRDGGRHGGPMDGPEGDLGALPDPQAPSQGG